VQSKTRHDAGGVVEAVTGWAWTSPTQAPDPIANIITNTNTDQHRRHDIARTSRTNAKPWLRPES
jgi:hypothetical protein